MLFACHNTKRVSSIDSKKHIGLPKTPSSPTTLSRNLMKKTRVVAVASAVFFLVWRKCPIILSTLSFCWFETYLPNHHHYQSTTITTQPRSSVSTALVQSTAHNQDLCSCCCFPRKASGLSLIDPNRTRIPLNGICLAKQLSRRCNCFPRLPLLQFVKGHQNRMTLYS